MYFAKGLHDDGTKRMILFLSPEVADQLTKEELAWLSFTTGRYEKLNREEEKWQIVIAPANQVFKRMTLEQKVIFAKTLSEMHALLTNRLAVHGGTILQLIDLVMEMAEILLRTMKTSNIWDTVTQVAKTIPISDMSTVGTREQDMDFLTFYEESVYEVLSIAIFAKCLTPIFTTTTTYMSTYVDQYAKDIIAMRIIEPVLEEMVPHTFVKLKNYIKYFVDKKKKKLSLNGQEFTQSFHMNTQEFMVRHVISKIITKNYVNADLLHTSGNIMVYTSSVIADNVQTRESNQATRKNTFYARSSPSTNADDPNQESQLELDSLVSDHLFDQVPLVRTMVAPAVRSFCEKYQITEEFLQAVHRHYMENMAVPPPHVMFLCGTIFGESLCGSLSINLLKYEQLSLFLALLQCICFKQGLHELGHSISMLPMTNEAGEHIKKSQQSPEDMRVKKSATSSDAFKILKERVNSGWFKDGDRLVVMFENMAMEFTESMWLLNIPVAIRDLCKQNPHLAKGIPCASIPDALEKQVPYVPVHIMNEMSILLVEALNAT